MEFILENEIIDSESKGVLITFIVCSLISVLSSIIILILYYKYENIKTNFGPFLIFLLALVDMLLWGLYFILSLVALIENKNFYYKPKSFCLTFGFILNLLNLFDLFLPLIIALSLCWTYCYDISVRLYKNYLLIGFVLFTIFLALIPFTKEEGYGAVKDDHYLKCDINDEKLRIYIFYVPLWVIFSLLLLLILKLVCTMRRNKDNESLIETEEMTYQFIWFPIVFFICWIIPSIRRVMNYSINDNMFLFHFMYILMPAQGFFNAIVYGLINQTVKEKLIKILKCWGDKRKTTFLTTENDDEERSSYYGIKPVQNFKEYDDYYFINANKK